ncbi:MAG: ABC transporter substrate-binding protein [Candidatus Methanomethylophilaceae archaeon]|nr:iron complex transport system substrate-binding protein [Candidatus Methanomethylophilaceae archaeon]
MEKTTKVKTVLSAGIVILCVMFTALAASGQTYIQGTDGLIVDFGGGMTYFGAVNPEDNPDANEGLELTCAVFGFDLVRNGDEVVSIDLSVSGTDGRTWGLYVVEKASSDLQQTYPWVKISGDPGDVKIKEYAAVAWAYCSEEETPSRAVDATGICFYGYGHPERIVSMAPSCTEMICSVGGERKLVGTDDYSNYPESVESARLSGNMASIGGFTNPSYESIVRTDPDLVICVNSQRSHLDTAERLRSAGINVVVADGGEDVGSIMESIMMVGTAMGIREAAENTVNGIIGDLSDIEDIIDGNSSAPKNAVIALSTDKSPWVSGSYTYASDVLSIISVGNSFSDLGGWVMVTSESLVTEDVDCIVVITSNGPRSQSEYQAISDSLGDEWKHTDAYRDGKIYFLTDSAADLASRAGPRVAQVAELMARIIQDTAFEGDMPKYIGDDYRDYISMARDPVAEGAS